MAKRRVTRSRRKPKADTSDVLGQSFEGESVPRRWRKQYNHLRKLRDKLLTRQNDLARNALEQQPRFSSHMADAATDTFDRDFALGMLSSEQDALYEIDEALNRIRDGTYGICELTGKKIKKARLEAIPWTRFTAGAERQLENEGAVKRARLGPRHTVVKAEATEEATE